MTSNEAPAIVASWGRARPGSARASRVCSRGRHVLSALTGRKPRPPANGTGLAGNGGVKVPTAALGIEPSEEDRVSHRPRADRRTTLALSRERDLATGAVDR